MKLTALACISILILSCGNKPTEKIIETLLENDTLDKKIEIYYTGSNQLREVYHLKDGLRHGSYIEYYKDGKVKSTGQEYYSYPIGFHKIYDSLTGELIKETGYILLKENDSIYHRVNEVLYYNQNGEIDDSRSTYFLDRIEPDTIKNGTNFRFGIKMFTPVFDSAVLIICDYDQYYNLVNDKGCQIYHFQNNEIALQTSNYKVGSNILRGIITIYNESSYSNIYYKKAFYVLP